MTVKSLKAMTHWKLKYLIIICKIPNIHNCNTLEFFRDFKLIRQLVVVCKIGVYNKTLYNFYRVFKCWKTTEITSSLTGFQANFKAVGHLQK